MVVYGEMLVVENIITGSNFSEIMYNISCEKTEELPKGDLK